LNYQDTLDYLFKQLPMFTRIGSAAYKKDLTNTLALCNVLDNPQLSIKTIHVAGTNGKGSTSHMLASLLQEAGFKTGLYTSPHLKDFRERIRINGKMISEEEVVHFVDSFKEPFENISPSFFEWTFALSLHHFKKHQVDIAVIETGLGGRLDSTNIIHPELSIITNIGWDHMDMLGDTLPKIAFEKAGIIKPNVPVVIGEFNEDTFPVFHKKVKETNSNLVLASSVVDLLYFKSVYRLSAFDASFREGMVWKNMVCDLPGNYQQKNIVTVITAAIELIKLGYKITEKHIRLGIEHVKSNTNLLGRWHILQQAPLIVADTGHNEDGLKYVVEQIKQQKYKQLHLVIGVVKDKALNKVLPLLPKEGIYYFTKANLPRALDEKELQAEAYKFGLKGKTYFSVDEAVLAAKASADKDDFIFIGGSTFIVAEAI